MQLISPQLCSALLCPSPHREPNLGCPSESGFGLSPRLTVVSTKHSLAGKSAPRLGKGLGHLNSSTFSGNPSHRWEHGPEEAQVPPGIPLPNARRLAGPPGVQGCASVSPPTPSCPGLASACHGVSRTLEGAGTLPRQPGVCRGPRQRVCHPPKSHSPLDPRRARGLRLWVRCCAGPGSHSHDALFPGQSHTHNSHGAVGGSRGGSGVPGGTSRVCPSDSCRMAWPASLFFPPPFLKSMPQFPCLEKEGLLSFASARRSVGPLPSTACTNRHRGCPRECQISNMKEKALPRAVMVPSNPDSPPVWKGLMQNTSSWDDRRPQVNFVP